MRGEGGGNKECEGSRQEARGEGEAEGTVSLASLTESEVPRTTGVSFLKTP